jgi:murein DD-endopeptidase MepM/ murein hydrolase activator NlpD
LPLPPAPAGTLVVLVVLVVLATAPAGAATPYRPPVDAPIVDAFRLPDGPFGAGNRGLEYATTPGTPVWAIGAGVVVFAGQVAGPLHVTVLHPDGLRSSYSYLAEILVKAGQHVAGGQVVGRTGERFHLGVRSGGTYLDPATLFTVAGVRLVPVGAGSPDGSGPATAPPPTRSSAHQALGWRTWDWLRGR